MFGKIVLLLACVAFITAQPCDNIGCGCVPDIYDNSNFGCGNFAEISTPLQLDGCQIPCGSGPLPTPGFPPIGLGPGPVVLPTPAPQPNVVISNNCNCVKTVVRPKQVCSVVSVPSESQTVQTFTRPVVQTINYQYNPPLNTGPAIPAGPIIDNSACSSIQQSPQFPFGYPALPSPNLPCPIPQSLLPFACPDESFPTLPCPIPQSPITSPCPDQPLPCPIPQSPITYPCPDQPLPCPIPQSPITCPCPCSQPIFD